MSDSYSGLGMLMFGYGVSLLKDSSPVTKQSNSCDTIL
jgi:hypothetical protein